MAGITTIEHKINTDVWDFKPADQFLGIPQSPHFTSFEKFFIQAMSRNVTISNARVGHDYDHPDYLEPTLSDDHMDSKIRDILYPPGQENGISFDEALYAVANLHKGDGNVQPISSFKLTAFDDILKGNFLERTISGKKDTCLDYSLTMLLIGKLYYPNMKIDLIPYNLESFKTKNESTKLHHDHYALAFEINGESYMALYNGTVIPLSYFDNPKENYPKLKELFSQTMQDDSKSKNATSLLHKMNPEFDAQKYLLTTARRIYAGAKKAGFSAKSPVESQTP